MNITHTYIEDIKINNVKKCPDTGVMAIRVGLTCLVTRPELKASETVSLSVIIKDGTKKTIEELMDESIKRASELLGGFVSSKGLKPENQTLDMALNPS